MGAGKSVKQQALNDKNPIRLLFMSRRLSFSIVGSMAAIVVIVFLIQQFQAIQGSERPGKTFGLIFVDSPEVYTRERLVNDRFQQDSWLRDQLDPEELVFGTQGVRSVETSSKTQIEASNIGEAASPEDSFSSDADPTGLEKTGIQASPIDTFRDELSYREEVRTEIIENQLDDRHDISGNTLYRLKFDATVIPQFDTSAYAMIEVSFFGPIDAVEEKASSSLTDTGEKTSTTEDNPYFQIDQMYAIKNEIDARMKPGSIAMLSSIYEKWLIHFQDDLNQRANLINSFVSQNDEDSLAAANVRSNLRNFLKIYFEDGWYTNQDEIELNECMPRQNEEWTYLGYYSFDSDFQKPLTTCANEWFSNLDNDRINTLIASYVAYGIHMQFPNINHYAAINVFDGVIIVEPLLSYEYFYVKESDEPGVASQPNVEDSLPLDFIKFKLTDLLTRLQSNYGDDFRQNLFLAFPQTERADKDQVTATIVLRTGLASFLKDIIGSFGTIYTYSVTPKESVQRISDAAQRGHEVELGITANFTQADLALKNTQGRNAQIQAIVRHPLVVGFRPTPDNGSQAASGWLIGPRFQIPKDPKADVNFRHVPIQQALTAIVSAPSWWQKMKVVAETYWLTETGDEVSRRKVMEKEISLPGDPSGISDVLLPGSDNKKPQIFAEETQEAHLAGCTRGSVLIQGRHLWRSTVVMLGTQRADGISVLPSMRGIVATFDEVFPPGEWKDFSRAHVVPLTVWTSEGMARFPHNVNIHKGKCSAIESS